MEWHMQDMRDLSKHVCNVKVQINNLLLPVSVNLSRGIMHTCHLSAISGLIWLINTMVNSII